MHFVKTFSVQIGRDFPAVLQAIDFNVADFFSDLDFETIIVSVQDAIYKVKGEEHFVRTIVYARKPMGAKQ